MRFRTTLLQAGKTATGIELPAEVVDGLGAGQRPPVRVTVNGYTYRSTIAVMGGVFMVGVNAANRAAAGVVGGEEIDVDVELDTEPRVLEVPPELAESLATNAGAKRFYDGLSYSRRRRLVDPILAAKTDETRQRRVARAVAELSEGKG